MRCRSPRSRSEETKERMKDRPRVPLAPGVINRQIQLLAVTAPGVTVASGPSLPSRLAGRHVRFRRERKSASRLKRLHSTHSHLHWNYISPKYAHWTGLVQ